MIEKASEPSDAQQEAGIQTGGSSTPPALTGSDPWNSRIETEPEQSVFLRRSFRPEEKKKEALCLLAINLSNFYVIFVVLMQIHR